jgi:hypothetical protein
MILYEQRYNLMETYEYGDRVLEIGSVISMLMCIAIMAVLYYSSHPIHI